MIQLNELDKNEWKDIVRKVRPDLTDEEFEEMWERFVRFKANKRVQ